MWHPSVVCRREAGLEAELNFDPALIAKGPYDSHRVPIIINNYNRLDCLRQAMARFRELGYERIYILDNNSDYEPLLDYYRTSGEQVIRLNRNLRYLALWVSDAWEWFRDGHYVYTDPDVVPLAETFDILGRFKELLDRYPLVDKVGCALKIDDLPDHFAQKESVVAHEVKHWEAPIEEDVYVASIDTTFALYRPGALGGYWLSALRVGGECQARHLPWYVDSANLSAEDIAYARSVGSATHWTRQMLAAARAKEEGSGRG